MTSRGAMRSLALVALVGFIVGACARSKPVAPLGPPAAAQPNGTTASAPTPILVQRGAPRLGAASQATAFDPSSFSLKLEPVARGFGEPTFVTNAGDGSNRMFVVEKAGTIRVIVNGRTLPDPFLDIRSLVGSRGSEQGLLGLAFHPHFVDNGRFFVMYTANNAPNGDNTIAEYRISSDLNRADPSSGRVLLAIPDFAPNHNGGMVAFGPDGYLYVGTGDGGGAGDPQRNGQNLGAFLGKLLRLDIDHDQPYAIPRDNPFIGRQGARPEIWAYGLRNPWRFSFDRASGDLYIADVGQDKWEEIDLQKAGDPGGENYGWSIMEGTHCFRPESGCNMTGLTPPVLDYGHDVGCSITGGYVYRGAASPALAGGYFYGDYCSGRVWALYRGGDGSWQHAELGHFNENISSFGEDEAGEVYLVGFASGTISRLTAAPR